MLDVVCDEAEVRDGEHRRADDVLIMHKTAVFGFVRVALRAEADDGGVLLVRHDADDAVRGDGVFIEHEGDDLSVPNGVRVHLFHIDQRAGVVRRLHGAGEHGVHLQTEEPCADEKQRQQHHERHQNAADDIPRFSDRAFLHNTAVSFPAPSVNSARKWGAIKL